MRFFATSAFFALLFGFIAPRTFAAPSNDNRNNAVVLATSNVVAVRGNNFGATAQSFESPLSKSVWYRWTAPVTATTTLDILAAYDSTVSLYVVSPLFPDPILIDFDDDGGEGLQSRIVFDATAGTTYFIAVDGFFSVAGTREGPFVLRLVQALPDYDDFATAAVFVGANFEVVGNNTGFTLEEGEPVHGGGALVNAGQSAWIRWTAPSRVLARLETEGRFDSVLAVYTGDSVDTLELVAVNDDKDIRSTQSALSFAAESGQTYHIAVSGRRGGAGPFTLSFDSSPLRPGIRLEQRQVTVPQAETATFSATVSSSGPASFLWQRRPRGSRTWTDLADGAGYTGSATTNLNLLSASLANDGDAYRLLATDNVGTTASRPVSLTVTEYPFIEKEVLGTVDFDLSGGSTVPPPSNGGSYFARGLPAGLSIDPATGRISGTISTSARPRTYRVLYGSTNGSVRNQPQYVVIINVSPFPQALSGQFEAILNATDAASAPFAKLSLNINRAGRFTGRVFVLGDSRTYPVRGLLDFDDIARTATQSTELFLPRRAPLSRLELRFTLSEPGLPDSISTLSAELHRETPAAVVADTTNGRQILTFGRDESADWAGRYTAVLGSPLNLETPSTRPVPMGSGYAFGTIDPRRGRLVLRGRLSDGTPLTAAMLPAAESRYLLAIRRYRPVGGSLSGTIALETDISAPVYRSRPSTTDSRLYWIRPAQNRAPGYEAGFGPLELSVLMSPWTRPSNDLPLLVGADEAVLDNSGSVAVLVSLLGEGVDNSTTTERTLPVNFRLGKAGPLTQADPILVSADPQFRSRVNAVTGEFSGSFLLHDQPTPPSIVAPPPRRATFQGVFVQDGERGDDPLLIGGGYFLFNLNGATTNRQRSGLIEVLLPAATVD